MADAFAKSSTGPFTGGELINLAADKHFVPGEYPRGFYATSNGNVDVILHSGEALTIPVTTGGYHPWVVKSFLDTSTAATVIVGK